MELKLNTTSAVGCEKICDEKCELSVELEALIPEYMPKVFKIVKCVLQPVVLTKRAGASRLTVEGFMRAVMFYQESAEGELCSLEQKQSFSKTFELETSDFESADIHTYGETEYVNCRAVNERRVDIRGAYMLSVYAYANVKKQIVHSLENCGIQQKSVAIKTVVTNQPYEKPITLSDDFVFTKEPDFIIDTTCICKINDCRISNGKAVCKGDAEIIVLYRTQGDIALIKESKILSFNEVAEIGDKASDSAFAVTNVVSTSATKDENGNYKISASILLDIYAQHLAETVVVIDAYSTEFNTQITYDKLKFENSSIPIKCNKEIAMSGKMPDTDAQIIGCIAELAGRNIVANENGVNISGKIVVHVFCKNSLGEIDCYDKDTNYIIPIIDSVCDEQVCIRHSLEIRSISIRKVSDEMSAVIIIEAEGLATKLNVIEYISDMQCTDLLDKDTNSAIHIYYASQGEKLFDIGKHYLVSSLQLAEVNDISDDTLPEKAHLLIPASV